MARMALYRAWRSQTFEDVIGQQHITQTLQNSLREERLSHAYLFTGPRGTGKTSTAKILAKAVNCERGPAPEPCNECEACRRITSNTCIDVSEFDAASNRGVEEIRDIRDKVKYAPTEVRNKVYIIDEVHMLTTEAFNALLKTLEEPPEHVIFVLATTEPHKVPATIHSRCQRFDFRRVGPVEQAKRMRQVCESEGIEADEDALAMIARLSDGGMRDALSLLDQAVSFTSNKVTLDGVLAMTGGVASEQFASLVKAIGEQDVVFVLEFVDRMMREGKSADKCLEGLLLFLRDMLLVQLVPDAAAVNERLSETEIERLREAAGGLRHDQLFRMIDMVNAYMGEMKYAAQPQTMLEVALLKLCVPEQEQSSSSASAEGAAASTSAAFAPPPEAGVAAELKRLAARIDRLEARGAAPAPSMARVDVRAGAAAGAEAAVSANALPQAKEAPKPVGAVRPTPSALGPFLTARNSEAYHRVAQEWPSILQRVKERKITVHAWLVDGEPVSATEDTILVAFKNTIHRETTEKPGNRELIESVFAERLSGAFRLATLMVKDWQSASESGGSTAEALPEPLELTPDDGRDDGGKAYAEEWINEAIELFGEDMVVIKE